MDRNKLLKDTQRAYEKWQSGAEFISEEGGAKPEDETKIMDELLSLVEKNKP